MLTAVFVSCIFVVVLHQREQNITSNNQRLRSAGEDDVWHCLLNKSYIVEGEVGLVCTLEK